MCMVKNARENLEDIKIRSHYARIRESVRSVNGIVAFNAFHYNGHAHIIA